ncbi:hypothetical protein RFI_37485 [Reticulomyxa filosa]|uniref:Uncharacterized protein n=1 Tax=Reticulomyxa filosa TaxID=46433 RepID=X6LDB8_RETFI|nr:hypothetical protein RFI_37485 [Reticulomyxa filosa]|eukprot:ETN99977.1 hypothetical protein RFI_37485 [Reticulomyxa filosa]
MELVLRTRFSLTTIIYFSKLTSLQYAVCIEHMKYEVIVEQGLWGGKKKETQDEGRNIREKQRHISALFKDVGKYMLVKRMLEFNTNLVGRLNGLSLWHSLDYVCDISKEANNLTKTTGNTDHVSHDALILKDIFPKYWTMTLFGYLIFLALLLVGESCTFWFAYDIHSLIAHSSIWKTESQGWDIFLCLAVSHALFAVLTTVVISLHFQNIVVQINQHCIWAHNAEKEILAYKLDDSYPRRLNFDFNEHLYLVNLETAFHRYFVVRYLHSICDDWMSQTILQFLCGSTREWLDETTQNEDASEQTHVTSKKFVAFHSTQNSISLNGIAIQPTYKQQFEFSGNKTEITRLIQAILEL